MINISTFDYFVAGFDDLKILDAMSDLEAYADLPLYVSIVEYVNGHKEGPETHSFYPARSLYEFPVDGAEADREALDQAIAAADERASEAGFGVQGERLYKLVLVKSEDDRIWVQVGNRWQD